jgi:hypothetical protein
MAQMRLWPAVVAVSVLVGCGSGSAKAPGGERGPCYPNSTCDLGLTCLSDFCVRVTLDGSVPAEGGIGTGGNFGTGGTGPGNDGGSTVDAFGGGFDIAPHPRLPQVANLGGPVLSAPKVLPIVYAGDPQVSDVEAFLAEVGTSAYWRETTSEYGVNALALLPVVTLPSASGEIADAALQSEIVINTSGTSPNWGPPDPSLIYLFLLPSGTTATLPGTACCTDFAGYHDEATIGQTTVPYAVACVCPGPGWNALDARTGTMSHELVEAATDPFPRSDPAYYTADEANVVWTLVTQGEVGDMCAISPDAFIRPSGSNYVVQRTWSNSAASLGHNPCVPAPKTPPYFNSAPALELVPYGSVGYETRGVQIPVGQTQTIPLNLFSIGTVSQDWTVSVLNYEDLFGKGSPSLSFSLDKGSGHNGDVLQLTISVLKANALFGSEPFIVLSTYGAPGDVDYQTNIGMGLVTN